jgi:hypothetical protein
MTRKERRKEREVMALTVLSVIKTRPALLRAVAEAMRDELRMVEAAAREARRLVGIEGT